MGFNAFNPAPEKKRCVKTFLGGRPMRKLIALCLVTALASSSFAYVPLSNSQTDLGSFRNGATRGMFYEEIDVLSASPVTLMDFGGTNLYTNWGNLRYSNDPTIANTQTGITADKAFTYNTAGSNQFFNMGIIGNPLSMIGIDNSRAGVVYQNWGSKTDYFNLDTVAGNESEGIWEIDTITAQGSNGQAGLDRYNKRKSDVKFYDNNTYTKWDVGAAYQGLILDDLVLGFGLSTKSSSKKRITGGSKGYADVYVSTTGATGAGMPATSTVGDSYAIDFADTETDVNSESSTDMLFQGRLPSLFGLQVEGGLGFRTITTSNPDILAAEVANAVTITGREDVNGGATPGVNGTQMWNTGTAIRARDAATTLDFNDTVFATGGNIVGQITPGTGFFAHSGTGANAGITKYSDERKGTGPIMRLQAMKEWSKVNVTGVLNYSTVKQDIGAEIVKREYTQTKWTNGAAVEVIDNYAVDYVNTQRWNGDTTRKELDLGGKIEMKALEGMKLAFGGFINTDSRTTNTNIPVTTVFTSTYDDGLATHVALTGVPSRANGEGTAVQTSNTTTNYDKEVLTTQYSVPVGAEIKLGQKWTLGVGTKYIMTKTATKETYRYGMTDTVTVVTPADTAVAATTTYGKTMPATSQTSGTSYAESHAVQYTYGVRYEVNKNLTLSCNAFLDTGANGAAVANGPRAQIFDLDTYRLLAIQAVFHF